MGQLAKVEVEITVVIGRSKLPMQRLLRMGRGAVIPLDASPDDAVWILANGRPIARGEIVMDGEMVSVRVLERASALDYA